MNVKEIWGKLIKSKEYSFGKSNQLTADLIRVMTEYEEGYLEEMLSLLAPVYGAGSVLSVISAERKVIASTDEDTEAVEHMARSIQVMDKKCYYLRNEKNSVAFRMPFNCVRVVPLIYRNKSTHYLVIEQQENRPVVADRCINLLSLAVRTYCTEVLLTDFSYINVHTGFKNRDALIRLWYSETTRNSGFLYLGLIMLDRDKMLVEGVSLEEYDAQLGILAGILQNAFHKDDVFCIGENRFAILLKDSMYECVAQLQDVIEICTEKNSVIVRGAVAFMDDDIYKALHICERACVASDTGEAVILIRNKEVDLNVTEEKFYSGQQSRKGGKEEDIVEDVDYKEIKEPSQSRESDNISSMEEPDEDLTFFNDIADIGDIAFDDV